MATDNKALNISALKGSLLDDDFGLLDGRKHEIDSIDSLSGMGTPPAQTPPATSTIPATVAPTNTIDEDDLVDDIEELEDTEVPEPDAVAPVTPTADKASDLIKAFSENLAEKGLIKFDAAEYDKSEDKDAFLESKIQETITGAVEEGVKAKEAEWPEEVAKLVELSKSGVPLHQLLEADARISSLENIETKDIEENIDLQKDILRELYATQGFSKERVESKLKRAEDLGTLKDDAADGFDVLLAGEKKAKQEMIKTEQAKSAKAEQDRIERIKGIEDSIRSADEIIPGFKLSEEDKKTLINGITKASATDKQGKPINALAKARLDDPKMDLKVAYFTLVLKGDLSKLQTKAATKTTRSLKSVIDSHDPIQGSTQSAGSAGNAASKVNKDVLRNSLKALRRTF